MHWIRFLVIVMLGCIDASFTVLRIKYIRVLIGWSYWCWSWALKMVFYYVIPLWFYECYCGQMAAYFFTNLSEFMTQGNQKSLLWTLGFEGCCWESMRQYANKVLGFLEVRNSMCFCLIISPIEMYLMYVRSKKKKVERFFILRL